MEADSKLISLHWTPLPPSHLKLRQVQQGGWNHGFQGGLPRQAAKHLAESIRLPWADAAKSPEAQEAATIVYQKRCGLICCPFTMVSAVPTDAAAYGHAS